jgi:hypothetical protein
VISLLNLYGVLGYGATTALIVIWIAIGLSYARSHRRWYLFVGCFVAYAVLFSALTVVAAEAPWLNRTTNMLVNRTAVWTGVILGAIFTWRYLRANLR